MKNNKLLNRGAAFITTAALAGTLVGCSNKKDENIDLVQDEYSIVQIDDDYETLLEEDIERKNKFDEKIYDFIINDYIVNHSVYECREYISKCLKNYDNNSYEYNKLVSLSNMFSKDFYSCVLNSLDKYNNMDKSSFSDDELSYCENVKSLLESYIETYESDNAFNVYNCACELDKNMNYNFFLDNNVYAYTGSKIGRYEPSDRQSNVDISKDCYLGYYTELLKDDNEIFFNNCDKFFLDNWTNMINEELYIEVENRSEIDYYPLYFVKPYEPIDIETKYDSIENDFNYSSVSGYFLREYICEHSIAECRDYLNGKMIDNCEENKQLKDLYDMLSEEFYSYALKSLESYYSIDRFSLTDEELDYADSVALYIKNYVNAYESDNAFSAYVSACDIKNNINFDFFLNNNVYSLKEEKFGLYSPDNIESTVDISRDSYLGYYVGLLKQDSDEFFNDSCKFYLKNWTNMISEDFYLKSQNRSDIDYYPLFSVIPKNPVEIDFDREKVNVR